MVNYNRQANFKRNLLLFRCSSTHSITHSSRSQYASYGGRRRLSRMSSILQATQITRCRLSAVQYSRMRILRLPAQSQDSENAQRNLEIAQISRLRGTYTQVQNNAGVEVSDYSAQCSQCSRETVMVILVCRSLHDQIRTQGIVRYKRNGRKLNNFKSGFR